MTRNQIPAFLISLFCVAASHADFAEPQYWEPSIARALISRDDFYREVGLELHPLQFDFLWDRNAASMLHQRVLETKSVESAWYHFLVGVTRPASSNDTTEQYFRRALELTSESPGMTWVLFTEFRRANMHQWAENALEQLEFIFLMEGAESVPIISQELLAIAREERKNRNIEQAIGYCNWSARFDGSGMWQALVRAQWHVPMRPRSFARACADFFTALGASWQAQVSLCYYVYRWLRVAVMLFIGVIFVTTAAKAIPHLFSTFGVLFARGVPRNARIALSAIVFASLALLGLVPFVIIASILFWRHIDTQDRTFLSICIAVTLCAAFDNRVSTVFVDTLSPNGSIGMFRRANDEGYAQEFEERLRAHIAQNPDDYLARVALANVLRKISDYKPMRAHLSAARRMREEDPVVLVASGNGYYADGDYAKAAQYYRSCIAKFPHYGAAYFNLLECEPRMQTGAADSSLLERAAHFSSRRIRAFAQTNKNYFGDDIPDIRRIIQPDYFPAFFWSTVFWEISGLKQELLTLHRRLIRSLPSLAATAAAIAIVLSIVSLVRRLVQRRSSRARDSRAPMRIVMKDGKYMRQRQKHLIYIPAAMDCVFPGSGSLLRTSRDVRHATVLMWFSSLVYASYWSVLRFSFSYPFWISRRVFMVLAVGCASFTIVHAVHAVRAMVKELRD